MESSSYAPTEFARVGCTAQMHRSRAILLLSSVVLQMPLAAGLAGRSAGTRRTVMLVTARHACIFWRPNQM